MPSSFCWYCGAEAHWICDYTLPMSEWKEGVPWCERAVCKAHSVSVAPEEQYCKEHAEAGIAEYNMPSKEWCSFKFELPPALVGKVL